MLRVTLLVLSVLVVSCGGREETPEYFTKVTGLPLCKGTTVRNVNAQDPGHSPGFDSIYIVDVRMASACKPPFLKAVASRIGHACFPSSGCSGNSANGDFYAVKPLPAGFRVTHST